VVGVGLGTLAWAGRGAYDEEDVCAYVRACVRACARMCVRACVRAGLNQAS